MRKLIAGAATAALLVGGLVGTASASLADSNFEIDDPANLVVDGGANALDWENVPAIVTEDEPSGSNDDSFGQGSKEDTAVPTVVSGSIPPNKSDLKEFGVYQEGTSSAGTLNLFWSRVQDPSGTTNMDFELNQSDVDSGNGTTPVRTEGDLLITYDLEKGGKFATISTREWNGSVWGPATDITANGDAAGTINEVDLLKASIPGYGEVGPYSPRTFGEAQVDLSVLFPADGTCKTFGSAYLKSRSSDSFTAALKDFIAPVPINVTNCGQVKIVKKDDAGNVLAGATFELYDADGATGLECTTLATGLCTIVDVPFGTYTVKETGVPTGYDPAPDQSVTISAGTPVQELEFTNPRQRGAIQVSKTTSGGLAQSGVVFTINGTEVTTDANGVACVDGLLFGDYVVTETVPDGFAGEDPKTVTVDNKATCADAEYVGETVAFVNTPLSKIAVGFAPLALNAATATIQCAQDGTDLVSDPEFPGLTGYTEDDGFTDLEPGTYVCTVVISAATSG